jgi:aspartate aminotransferase
MTAVAQRTSGLAPPATMNMHQLAQRLRAEGRDVIGLVGGEPDYDTPENVKDAGIAAIRDNITRYPSSVGTLELRQALSRKFRDDNKLDYPPEQILVLAGTKPLLTAATLALADPGDEIIIPVPFWVSYPNIALMAGCKPVLVNCPADNGFKLRPSDLEAAITPHTRLLFLNSPNNPTGAVYSEADQRRLLEVLLRHPDVWVATDEIYEDICFTETRPVSFATLDPRITDRVITVNGFSKGYAMAGWRLGFAGGPREAIRAMARVSGHIAGSAAGFTQVAAVKALTDPRPYLRQREAEYRRCRDLVVTAINQMPGLSTQVPDGAFFVWGDCSGMLGRRTPDGRTIGSDEDFVTSAIEHAGVVVMPGSPFGMSPYFRLCYSAPIPILEEAMKRLRGYCNRLS